MSVFLSPYSIDLLAVSTDLKSELHRFGLHTMGAVASMSRHVLADRFGPEGERAWSLSSGIDDSPVAPLAFEESVVERTSLPFHSSSIEVLSVSVDTLLKRAYSRPDLRSRYAGATSLLCTAAGWPNWEKAVRFKEPVGVWQRASEIVRSRLEADPPRNPVEDVTLHPVRFHRRGGNAVGAVEGREGRRTSTARRGGSKAATAEGRRSRPVQDRPGSALAPRAGDEGISGAHRYCGQGFLEAGACAEARGRAGGCARANRRPCSSNDAGGRWPG